MRQLVGLLALLGVALIGASGPALAQLIPLAQNAAQEDRASAEAEKAAASSGKFQLTHAFNCRTGACTRVFYKIPDGKDLELTSFSCFTIEAVINVLSFKAASTGDVSAVTPTTNGSMIYTGQGFVPLLISGGDKLVYVDYASGGHQVQCTVRGVLK